MPELSVLMSVYNAERFIGNTIESILNQTYRDFELIIIDDGSTDSTVKIINSYNDKRIKLYHMPSNSAGGATTWERLYLELPTIAIAVAENQVETLEALNGTGLVRYLGLWTHNNVIDLYRKIKSMKFHLFLFG